LILRLGVAVLSLLIGVSALTARPAAYASTTTLRATSFTYDAPAAAPTDTNETVASEATSDVAHATRVGSTRCSDVAVHSSTTPIAGGVATNSGGLADDVVASRNLGRQLASEQQVGEAGTAMAGAGTSTELRAASRLADRYGGAASDWAKMGSSSYRGADGLQFETHWYENISTGQRLEFKTKITGGAP